jgi:Cu+-exporting ATPase
VYRVYFALGAAVLTFLITYNLRSTISVIIVAGACGIAAGTPLAILGAIGRAARNGCIIKGGIYLEALGQLHTVFLDKTGTLTYGTPLASEIHTAPGISERTFLEAAPALSGTQSTPLDVPSFFLRSNKRSRLPLPKLSSTALVVEFWRL